MKIVDLKVRTFNYISTIVRDDEGHTHPGGEHDAQASLLTITADDGTEGHSFGPVRQAAIDAFVKPLFVGRDPYDREKLWQHMVHNQRGSGGAMNDRVIATAELALWDLAGRKLGLPVYKLLGAYRDKVPAYGSTMCGDELRGGLSTPDDYARFAEWLVKRGYKSVKLHTWMPPIKWAPDPRMDVKACAAVREAVGPDIACTLDSYHGYSREEAYYIGRELEKLGYYWLEEPMNEHSTSSYVWLTEQLDIPILGPESAEGRVQTRAEWIVRKASDMTRAGVMDVGGIIPTMKIAHLAEAHGVACEIHSPGGGNLHVLGAMGIPGKWYERGLLHPFTDYEAPAPWLNSIIDPMDRDGFVPVPQRPGLGYDISFDYINGNLVK
jgi:L-alanine-DL-glutamate epimerase-like enolase superfamily enzyme